MVARGFQEDLKPQSDSPTAHRGSLKLFMAICALNNVENITAIDIKAAFLQSDKLDRDVYMKVPNDIRKEGFVWKLLKPLYGLDDASRKFWLKVKDILKREGLEAVPGDPAFYIKRKEGKPEGVILTHVDDFLLGGSNDFVEDLISKMKEELTISKVEAKKFRFTGVDVEQRPDSIVVSMNDYAKSILPIEEIRYARKAESLNEEEKKMFRTYVGKISWIAENTHPDLAYSVLKLWQKS